MVDSGVGRTERAEIGHRRPEARALAKAQNREMRKPRTLFAPIDADRFEPLLQLLRDPVRAAVLVGEDEHADAARLAVANGFEYGSWRTPRGCPHGIGDGRQLGAGPGAEERERDVEVLARDDAPTELLALPLNDSVQDGGGQGKAAEESKAIIALDATGSSHTRSRELCVRSVRKRWSATAVDRRRICSRSPGRLSSRLRSPSDVAPCR